MTIFGFQRPQITFLRTIQHELPAGRLQRRICNAVPFEFGPKSFEASYYNEAATLTCLGNDDVGW